MGDDDKTIKGLRTTYHPPRRGHRHHTPIENTGRRSQANTFIQTEPKRTETYDHIHFQVIRTVLGKKGRFKPSPTVDAR